MEKSSPSIYRDVHGLSDHYCKHYNKNETKFKFKLEFIIFFAPLCELVAKQEMSDFPDHQSASSRNNLIYYEKYGSIYIPGF